ncbi:MAG: hypothetical protein HOB79_14840 [Rhodospirillaceae bacterium]|mgnify:CR=1 FL=1|nr:hypothetical protein [Rhodospirillaceae bacterium]MBT7484960.1 hypothetical protein [Rhodospirillales bacterium]MBT4702345.1 hypothetical protein [Rhodospirillaceae bacterium]MBT5036781.1 hypothetical protein [Rhodospirillaceae bacterium]MBT6222289.1 hypothetical protein [Rhodospirillaceae bacterium]
MSAHLMDHYAILRDGHPYKVMHCTENIIQFSVGYLSQEHRNCKWSFFKVTDCDSNMPSPQIH